MRKLASRLTDDQNGAALIEYTVLIGLMLAGVLAIVTTIGGWVTGQWSSLNTAL